MKRLIGITAVGILIAGCSGMPMMATGPTATAALEPTKGNTTKGDVKFAPRGSKVLVSANVSGLSPGTHGFHIHDKGDCSSGDGMSAGGHFNPLNKPHGGPTTMERHVGDMPSLVADASGNATLSVELDTMSLTPGATNIIGKAVIVHKDPDDYTTQPTGNAGARVACGVIR